MQVVSFAARQARTQYRHQLRTLTYVTLDAANGGIIRNLNSEGVALQAVAPLRQHQRVRLRFELRFPRLRIETYGQVRWANSSGQCGVRFVDLPLRTNRAIGEWILSNLLDGLAREPFHHSIFQNLPGAVVQEKDLFESSLSESDGLMMSAKPRPSILPERNHLGFDELTPLIHPQRENPADRNLQPEERPNWLSRPISARTLAWLVDALVMTAALLLFTLIFLSITHELPDWRITVGAATAAVIFVASAYWALFALFGGASLGARLAEAAAQLEEEEGSEADRFR